MIKFGTGGFRGIIGDNFTKENVQRVAQGLCDIIHEQHSDKPVVIGYDYRFCSDFFAAWVAEVLIANGVKCLIYDEPMPTPAIMLAVRDEQLDYGIMITASHNPYYFNGLKLFTKDGMDADVEFTNLLEQKTVAVTEIKTATIPQSDLVRKFSNKQRYIDNVISFLSSDVNASKVKVLYDNMAGVGSICIVPLFNKLGVQNFTVLHSQHDAFFNFVNPNPTRQAMSALQDMLLRDGYSFAMATDSDSDRLGILDEKGNYVSANDIFAALYYYLVKYCGLKGDIVKNFVTSVVVDKLADKFGYKCHTVDVGFKNISAAIRQHDALLGGESSGGLTMRGYIYGKDSVFSSALFLEMVTAIGKPVSQIIEEMHTFAGYDYCVTEAEVPYDGGNEIIARVLTTLPDFGRRVVETVRMGNNAKFCFENGCWTALRLSGTEPMIRICAELENEKEAERIIKVLKDTIK